MNKTLALKILDSHKIYYNYHEYDSTITTGTDIASILHEDVNNVYKTLVCEDNTKHYYVFVIPVDKTLDLKLIAKELNKKSIDMIKQKELEPLTGYIHGGCSPLGMKKKFPTYYDSSILNLNKVYVSAGKVGLQMELNPNDLIKITDGKVLDLVLK